VEVEDASHPFHWHPHPLFLACRAPAISTSTGSLTK